MSSREPTEEELLQLMRAAENGHIATLQNLILNKNINVNCKGPKGRLWYGATPLLVSARYNQSDAVDHLLQWGADINAVDQAKETVLHLAARRGSLPLVKRFISAGQDVNAVNNGKHSPLHIASRYGHALVVETLIKNGAMVNQTDGRKRSPLHIASWFGHALVVDTLIKNGAIVNQTDDSGLTPLDWAVSNGHGAVVWTLVKDHKVDISQCDEKTKKKISRLLAVEEERRKSQQDSSLSGIDNTDSKKNNRNQELQNVMIMARNNKYSIPVRYGKVLLCGAAAAGKSNFLNLLMEDDFQPKHISTEVLKPQQVTIAMKAVVSSNKDKVEFKKMNIDDEIMQLESYLPEKYTSISPTSASIPAIASHNMPAPIENTEPENSKVQPENISKNDGTVNVNVTEEKLALASIQNAEKLVKKPVGTVWDILTFMDTGGQPQFISMLPAVNSFAMITFVIHKIRSGGQKSLDKVVEVQFGNEEGEISFSPHPHKYTYHQLIETLISYASNILLPDTTFLNRLKVTKTEDETIRSIMLVGTHSDDDQISENDVENIDVAFTNIVEKSGVNHVRSSLNENYQYLLPVDNKTQGKHSVSQFTTMDTKRYTTPSKIRRYIREFLNFQDIIVVPIKWLLLELEIRKVCQERNCNLISYSDVLKLAKEKKLDYNGEFSQHVKIDTDQFIKLCLRFHHSFGVLLYFEDVDHMQNLVITNHQWLFNKLSKIVEYSFTGNTLEEKRDLRKGILRKKLLNSDCLDITNDFESSQIDTKSINPMNAFLKLLEHLRIAAPFNENDDKYFMPCLLESCGLTDLSCELPKHKENNIKPLLIQFRSKDNKTFAFPRGVFCFLIVHLMISKKWNPFGKTYVNFITLCKKDTGHYITFIDRIFCLEIRVTGNINSNVHDKLREIIHNVLLRVSRKLNICGSICYGFACPCDLIKDMHVSYLREDNDKYCYCIEEFQTILTVSHTVWLKGYYKNLLSVKDDTIVKGTDKPTLKLLNKHVRSIITPYWKDLGIQLLLDRNIPNLGVIERNNVHNVEACCGEMFEYWLEVDEEASWNKLINALEEINQNTLAVNIMQNILKDDSASQKPIDLSSVIFQPDSSVVVKEVYYKFYPKLVELLPMKDAIFVSYLIGLLPGDLKGEVESKATKAKAATCFLDNGIKPALESGEIEPFNILLLAMEALDSIPLKNLAHKIKYEIQTNSCHAASSRSNQSTISLSTNVKSDAPATGSGGQVLSTDSQSTTTAVDSPTKASGGQVLSTDSQSTATAADSPIRVQSTATEPRRRRKCLLL